MLGILIITLAGCGDAGDAGDTETAEEEMINVETAYPVVRTIAQPGSYMGTIETGEKVSVVPRVGGYVRTRFFGLGDVVNAGDVLFTIDDSSLQLEKEKAEEDVKEAEAALNRDKAENESAKYEVNETLNTLDTKTLENNNEIQKALRSEYEARLELYKACETEHVLKDERASLEELIRKDKDKIEDAKDFSKELKSFRNVYDSINDASSPGAAENIAVENGISRSEVAGKSQNDIAMYYLGKKTMYNSPEELNQAISESESAEDAAKNSLSEHESAERNNDISIIEKDVDAQIENGDIASAQDDVALKRKIAADYEIFTKAKIWADSQAKLAAGDAAVLESSTKLSKAEIDLEIAELNLQYAKVTSPVSGEIIECNIGDFGMASDQDVAYTIIDKSKKKAVFYVTSDAKNNMTPGQKVTIDRDGNDYSATVNTISNTPDAKKLLYRVTAVLAEDDRDAFDVGTSIRLITSVKKSDNALTVPIDVVYYDEGRAYVYVARDGVAVKIPIETGIEDEKDVEVLSGLTEDDQVIVNWSEQLQDNVPVNITKAAEKAAVVPAADEQKTEEVPLAEAEEEEAQKEIPEAVTEASANVEVITKVNIRKEPDKESVKLDTVPAGTRFQKIGEEADGWTKISYNDGEAYIRSDYVRECGE